MNKKTAISITLCVFITLLFVSVEIPDLKLDYSKVVYDENGQLLSASIASDEQWRFPIAEELPEQLKQSIILYEDEYFNRHLGVNPISLFKAIYKNLKAKRIVRGGSTITMQVMRMYRGNRSRTYKQKFLEIVGAIKLELCYSKSDILKMWASIAPFGGNTVGASTASWRYFNRQIDALSWAEYATLAVLPNTPAKVHMHKNVALLTTKRNHLLSKLYNRGSIDSIDYVLALREDISFKKSPLPQHGLHFMDFLSKKYPDKNIFYSTINGQYQKQLTETLEAYSSVYQLDGINNASAIIFDLQTNEVKAYVGNTKYNKAMRFVDCIQAPRSYGSLLKPLLYAYAIDQGYFLPNEKIKDIPSNFNGFVPKNFDRKFRGVVPMDQMVSKSLNVPAVRILNYVGVESFHSILKKDLGFSFINKNVDHHGLSLILGGAECSMWEIARSYKGLIRNHLQLKNPYNELKCLADEKEKPNTFAFHPLSSWYAIKAMMSLNRPKEEQNFVKIGGQKIAWKTGTSYGHRDAWAIGANERYVVGVWIGNEDGHGVFNLTGAKKAGPVLFKIFRYLDEAEELQASQYLGEEVEVCKETGMLKGKLCANISKIKIPINSHKLRNCDNHQVVINDNHTTAKIKADTLFYLHPTEEFYYHNYTDKSHSNSKISSKKIKASLSIVYPEANTVIFIPKKLKEEYSKVVLKANSTIKDGPLFWFLNGEFLQKSKYPHTVHADLNEGNHTLLVNDENGNKRHVDFSVVKRLSGE